MNTVIRNASLLAKPGELPVQEGGSVHIQDGRIVYAGAGREPGFVPDRVIDARGGVVMPGFINTHTHVAMNILRGYADDLPLQEWLFERIFPAEAKLTDEMVYWSSLGAMCELLRSGTTCINDMYDHCEAIAEAVEKSGMRAVLARGVVARGAGGWESKVQEAEDFWHRWNGRGRIRVWFGPHGQYTNTEESLGALGALAKKYGAGIHTHLSETRREHEDCRRETGRTPAELYAALGLMDVPFVAAHCVWTEEKDMELMAEKGAACASCPRSNMKLGAGIAPLHTMKRKGLLLSLGTDSAASNNRLSMMTEAAYAAYAQKALLHDPSVFPAEEMLRMATAGGAQALRLNTGELTEGKEADLIIFSDTSMRWTPRTTPASSIVYAAQDCDVRLTMVGGEVVYEDGQFSFADEAQVLQKLDMLARQLVASC